MQLPVPLHLQPGPSKGSMAGHKGKIHSGAVSQGPIKMWVVSQGRFEQGRFLSVEGRFWASRAVSNGLGAVLVSFTRGVEGDSDTIEGKFSSLTAHFLT